MVKLPARCIIDIDRYFIALVTGWEIEPDPVRCRIGIEMKRC
jgi:hypothetical protein